ncbi:Hypothetical protein, putative [Bodo saltans]|uniref:Uncharacterized protein n=1 Tax=Bodo saltans TaxID=75058 RepID=A0A0S4IK02_BODSA|nr:Hypothetical protein, putative [Bodo saltans]|eukprot:CUE58895.1 Hypothetical protein, putative [Bodo saltans]
MSRFALRNSQQSSNDRQPQKKKSASRQPSSCSALRAHRLARGGNESGNATTPPVYYALDLHAGIAGHALEELLSGIGQYVQEGLRELQIPWIVPCSDEWQNNRSPGSRAPLIWTQFFLELNDALQFPFYPVDFYKHFDVDSPEFSPLVFSAVHFASAHFGMNALCFKKLLESLLWPHAARLGGERNWTDVSEKRFESLYDKFPLPMPARLFRNSLHAETSSFVGAGQNNTRSVAANIALSSAAKWSHHEANRNPNTLRNASNGVLQPTNRWQSNKRIAILKVHKKTSTTGSLAPVVNSLERSYLYSLRFDRLLLLQRILPLSPTLPLFERMWHVNNAELIVTTWGSTSTTVMNLLFEGHRQHNHSGGVNDDDHGGSRRILTKRILVLVHSSYCHEAFHVFRTSKKFLCDPQRFSQTLPSTRLLSTIVRQKVSRNTGDLADHYGGKHFCVMYVLTQSLRLVGRRELDFRC